MPQPYSKSQVSYDKHSKILTMLSLLQLQLESIMNQFISPSLSAIDLQTDQTSKDWKKGQSILDWTFLAHFRKHRLLKQIGELKASCMKFMNLYFCTVFLQTPKTLQQTAPTKMIKFRCPKPTKKWEWENAVCENTSNPNASISTSWLRKTKAEESTQ